MPGQGFHLAVAKMYCDRYQRKFSDELILGTLVPDALNEVMGGRRISHYCGGGSCAIPAIEELKTLSAENAVWWDNEKARSYILDPPISLKSFTLVSTHGGDYRKGLDCHYAADFLYDHYVQEYLFDVSTQQYGHLVYWRTGEKVSEVDFRKDVDIVLPVIDQRAYRLAGITKKEIGYAKGLVREVLPEAQAEFLCERLRYDDEKLSWWPSSRFFAWRELEFVFRHAVEFPRVIDAVMERDWR